MVKDLLKVKLNSKSMQIAIGGFALLLVVLALAQLGVVDLTSRQTMILQLGAIGVILSEIGLVTVMKAIQKRGKGLDVFQIIGLLGSTALLVTIVAGFFGTSIAWLDSVSAIVTASVAGSLLIEAFVR